MLIIGIIVVVVIAVAVPILFCYFFIIPYDEEFYEDGMSSIYHNDASV